MRKCFVSLGFFSFSFFLAVIGNEIQAGKSSRRKRRRSGRDVDLDAALLISLLSDVDAYEIWLEASDVWISTLPCTWGEGGGGRNDAFNEYQNWQFQYSNDLPATWAVLCPIRWPRCAMLKLNAYAYCEGSVCNIKRGVCVCVCAGVYKADFKVIGVWIMPVIGFAGCDLMAWKSKPQATVDHKLFDDDKSDARYKQMLGKICKWHGKKGREGDRKRGRVTASKPRLAAVSSIQHTHIKHNEHQLKCKITQKYTTRQSRGLAEGRGQRVALAHWKFSI